MKLNKASQYAILFAMYLSRAGRANLDSASESLGLSRSFLEQVSRKMRIGGVVKSVRGPGGGYELISSEVSLLRVIETIAKFELVSGRDYMKYATGQTTEERAMARLLFSSSVAVSKLLSKSVKTIVQDSANKENILFNQLNMEVEN